MKRPLYMFLFLCLLSPPLASGTESPGERWVWIAADPSGNQYYMDKESRRFSAGIVTVWYRIVFPQPQEDGTTSSMLPMEIDCRSNKFRILGNIEDDTQRDLTKQSSSAPWYEVTPGFGESISRTSCQKEDIPPP